MAELTELARLDLHGAQVTKAGVAELKTVLPNCKINHSAEEQASLKSGKQLTSERGNQLIPEFSAAIAHSPWRQPGDEIRNSV